VLLSVSPSAALLHSLCKCGYPICYFIFVFLSSVRFLSGLVRTSICTRKMRIQL
jgi:hypothetical protein